MIYKCPCCDGAVTYQPEDEKAECPFCGNVYEVEQISEGLRQLEELKKKTEAGKEASGDTIVDLTSQTHETMKYQVCTCTSCGGELLVNRVEASTFCAYCGQPTIVFDRISDELKPDYVLPFKITSEQAVERIRQRFSKGFFVPNEIRNFEIERVRGIYIPYYLVDVYCHGKQTMRGVDCEKHTEMKYTREADCEYRGLLFEASKKLSDDYSMLLGGFDVSGLKPFDAGYLSGFYADRFDTPFKKIRNKAHEKVKKDFEHKMIKSVNAKDISVLWHRSESEVRKKEYALMPVWFMTFRHNNEPYTMMVNGQNGEVVGTVPVDKKKMITIFVIAAIISCFVALFPWLAVFMLLCEESYATALIIVAIIAVIDFALFLSGRGLFASWRKNLELTKAVKTDKFVKERQE